MLASDLDAVCWRDREVFGADRGRLLAALFDRAPECAWVACDAGEVAGYTFGRPGYLYSPTRPGGGRGRRHGTRHGHAVPFATRRKSVRDRCALLDAAWLDFLKSVGFVEERRFLRMFLRGHVHPGIPARQYAICGPEFA